MAGQPPSCLLFGERTMHLSELLLKEGKGISVHGQLAGSVPRTHPSSPSMSTHSAINWHGPRLKYLPGTCKQKTVRKNKNNDQSMSQLLLQHFVVVVVF